MNHGKRCLLSAGTVMVIAGCSGSERSGPEATASQVQPLAAPAVTLTPAILSPAGLPVGHTPAVIPVLMSPVPGSANAAQAALADPNERTTLRGMALRAASTTGGSPKTIHGVAASDRQSAERIVSGATIYDPRDPRPVYVISITGGPFTANRHPPGTTGATQGNVLTLTVDAATHEVTDVGLVNVEPDLSQIGPAIVDLSEP